MESIQAHDVLVIGCTEQCEGWIEFRWLDPLMGWERLKIDFDGFCSRRIDYQKSGRGLLDMELGRDHVRVWFTDELASKLGLPIALEIGFDLTNEAFTELQGGMDCIGWPSPPTRPAPDMNRKFGPGSS